MTTVSQGVSLPSRFSVRSVIERLVERDVTLADATPVPAKTTNVVAVYVDDKLATAALVVMDLECAARLGGASGTLTRGTVEDAISGRALSPLMRDKCHRLLDDLSAAFVTRGPSRVRLYEMYGPRAAVPADVAALTGTAGPRMDVALRITGYGAGLMSIIVR